VVMVFVMGVCGWGMYIYVCLHVDGQGICVYVAVLVWVHVAACVMTFGPERTRPSDDDQLQPR
jgi:hypothetical protein